MNYQKKFLLNLYAKYQLATLKGMQNLPIGCERVARLLHAEKLGWTLVSCSLTLFMSEYFYGLLSALARRR